ncbi:hypothetical protein C0431_12265 [bacterium]|nr:hypothetical protein [bacterium]
MGDGMKLKDVPIDSWVMDKQTIVNGAAVRWKILNQNHPGYPANTTTLIGVINTANPYEVMPAPYNNNMEKSTFIDFDTSVPSPEAMIRSKLSEVFNQIGKGLKERIIDTTLDIAYTERYASNSPRFRQEVHKIFLIGAKEVNPGSSTSLIGPLSQSYFPAMSLSKHDGIGAYLGVDPLMGVMSRDIKISSSNYYTAYPGFLRRQSGSYITSTLQMLMLAPIINVDNETPVAGVDEGGTYLLDLSIQKYLLKRNEGLYKVDDQGGLPIMISETLPSKDVFMTYGINKLNNVQKSTWGQFGSGFEILCFKEDDLPLQLKVESETLYDEVNKRYAGTGRAIVEEINLPQGVKQIVVQALYENVTFSLIKDGVNSGACIPGVPVNVEGPAKIEVVAELTSGVLEAFAVSWV